MTGHLLLKVTVSWMQMSGPSDDRTPPIKGDCFLGAEISLNGWATVLLSLYTLYNVGDLT